MSPSLLGGITVYIESQGGREGLFPTQIESVNISRSYQQWMPMRQIYGPSLCVVAQGVKEILFGAETLRYGAMECLDTGQRAGRRRKSQVPYIGITIDLDVTMLREVLEQLETPPVPPAAPGPCVFVGKFDEPLAECMLRLIRMSQTPKAMPIPLSGRHARDLLLAPHRPAWRRPLQSGRAGLEFMRVAKAIYFLRANFYADVAGGANGGGGSHEPVIVLSALQAANLGDAASPKQLRLLESRRLMVADAASVEEAGYKVGNESPPQFSRE